ncbi:MAG: hypothetical protein V2A77_02505 [Pseudomonadota bacterium]
MNAAKLFNIGVFEEDGLLRKQLESGVLVFVFTAAPARTLATIYADANLTSKSNPITAASFAADDEIRFWGTAASYDILVVYPADGRWAELKAATPGDHNVLLSKFDKERLYVAAATFNNAVETDSGLDLLPGDRVYDVGVLTITADTGETIDIGLLSTGTGGDADGFAALTTIASTAYVHSTLPVFTVGSSETYVSTAATVGILLGRSVVGTDANEDTGIHSMHGYRANGTNTSQVTYTCSSGTDVFAGYIFLYVRRGY